VDPNYPYPGGVIGVPGWDAFAATSSLKNKSTFTDVMGYCSNQWISDYTYLGELNFRASSSLGFVASDATGKGQPGLLIWGRIENGKTILEPAFTVSTTGVASEPGPYTWEAQDALGQVVASASFDAPEVADLPNTSLRIFSFIVPMAQETLSRVQSLRILKDGRELTRNPRLAQAQGFKPSSQASLRALPNRSMQISWNAALSPVVMLRDRKTGEVRGFLRGGAAVVSDVPPQLEIQFSDGVSGESMPYASPESH
jgi:hypothetical protein